MKTGYDPFVGKHIKYVSKLFILLFSTGFLFAQGYVTVSGGATTAAGANGTYYYAGSTNIDGTERPYFDMPASSYRVEYRDNPSYGKEWEVWESTARAGSGTVRFYNISTSATPPNGAWELDVASGSPVVTYYSNQTPVLASIEGTTLSYTEGQAATAISSTITVSDNDDTNMESATVPITGSYKITVN